MVKSVVLIRRCMPRLCCQSLLFCLPFSFGAFLCIGFLKSIVCFAFLLYLIFLLLSGQLCGFCLSYVVLKLCLVSFVLLFWHVLLILFLSVVVLYQHMCWCRFRFRFHCIVFGKLHYIVFLFLFCFLCLKISHLLFYLVSVLCLSFVQYLCEVFVCQSGFLCRRCCCNICFSPPSCHWFLFVGLIVVFVSVLIMLFGKQFCFRMFLILVRLVL